MLVSSWKKIKRPFQAFQVLSAFTIFTASACMPVESHPAFIFTCRQASMLKQVFKFYSWNFHNCMGTSRLLWHFQPFSFASESVISSQLLQRIIYCEEVLYMMILRLTGPGQFQKYFAPTLYQLFPETSRRQINDFQSLIFFQ